MRKVGDLMGERSGFPFNMSKLTCVSDAQQQEECRGLLFYTLLAYCFWTFLSADCNEHCFVVCVCLFFLPQSQAFGV